MHPRKTTEQPDIGNDAASPKGPKTEVPLRAISTKLLDLLYLPCLRKRSVSDPGRIKIQINKTISTKLPDYQDSGYKSFPPPTFQQNGQPRALESRLYPEFLDPNPTTPVLTRPHTSTDIPIPPIPPHLSASLSRRAVHHISSQTSLPKPSSLSLRGGKLKALADDERIPKHLWYLSDGRGTPPTAGEFRAWRAKKREKMKTEEKKRAEDKESKKAGKINWLGMLCGGKGKDGKDKGGGLVKHGAAASTEVTSEGTAA